MGSQPQNISTHLIRITTLNLLAITAELRNSVNRKALVAEVEKHVTGCGLLNIIKLVKRKMEKLRVHKKPDS